jgi:creatinine amidohydrolase
MSTSWLANAESDTAWAHQSWTDFDSLPERGQTLVVLPVHGLADHGLGLPLDAEELAGSALLRDASRLGKAAGLSLRVLPPLRFGLAPYPSTFFGVDPEAAHDHVREIASSIRASGFLKLVFFVTSPWHEEWIDAASRDVRVELGLQTFVINLSGLGLDFHPASESRAQAQAVVSHYLGKPPASSARPADIRDESFRPGNFRQPSPLAASTELDGATLASSAAHRLARLLAEIDARAPLGLTDSRPVVDIPPRGSHPGAADAQAHFPSGYRSHYLPSLTRDELESWPDKEHTLVILPTGSIEQHGHHLPVGVDAILGQAWLAHTLPKLPQNARVLVTPPITFGKSNEHTGFAGTVFISAKTLRRLLLAMATQLHALGFRNLAILNTHGGNSAVIVYTLREIQTTLGLRAGMLNFPYKPDVTPQEAEYGFHAGEWETALMLGCAPELVRMEKATCEYPARLDDPGELRPENAPAVFSWISSDISKSGVMGDATKGTRAKGLHWLDLASTALAKRITALLP